MDDQFLLYAAGIAAVGFVTGGLIAFVVRTAQSRRQVEVLDGRIADLSERLATAAKGEQEPQQPAPRRWTATEIAAIIGAIGTLVGVLGTIRGNDQRSKVTDLQTEVTRLTTELKNVTAEKAAFEDATRSLITYKPAVWQGLVATPIVATKRRRPLDVNLSEKLVSAPCHDRREVTLRYGGPGPAILKCGAGTTTLALESPTRMLLLPDPTGAAP